MAKWQKKSDILTKLSEMAILESNSSETGNALGIYPINPISIEVVKADHPFDAP